MNKVLIIDDSPDALEIAKVRLSRECLEIFCAEGGVQGIEMARREKPDLVLLDLDMPDMSGLDVLRSLKSDVDLCMIPVVFLTAVASAEDKVRCLDMGAIDYILKPFDSIELRARIRAALRNKHMQDLLIEYAHIDPLTGLPNRRALMEHLKREWARIERHGGELSLIMVDLDHFKQVNDTYGHHIGDKLLQEIGGAIIRQCRLTDLPARYGGEEFSIVVAQAQSTGAIVLAERCRKEIANTHVVVDGDKVGTTASFGIAGSLNAISPETLLKRADEALYQAKELGRNKVQICEASAASIPPVAPTAADASSQSEEHTASA
jgi:two-component system, cell cycle response regulator